MGKKIRLDEARRSADEAAVTAHLRAHSKAKTRPAAVSTYHKLAPCYRDRIEPYRELALRQPEHWCCRVRSRSPERRFLALVKFTFASYPVARHLERAWIEETDRDWPDFRHWYIIAAQGGSLYKQAAHTVLSKLETHHFLNAPEAVGSSRRACWYAVARAQTEHLGVAWRIAQSRLAAFPINSSCWKETARYFARNPTSIAELNDLIDFLRAAREADENYSLKGRGLVTLRRRMAQWHRELRSRAMVCGGNWEGHAVPDGEYQTGNEHNRAIWRFRQIKTGNDLFKEGQRMHHCVVTYKSRCMTGDISIWSLSCEFPVGKLNRGVTLEVRNDGTIVQCRGFANRLPYANEVSVVKRWANDHGLRWQAIA